MSADNVSPLFYTQWGVVQKINDQFEQLMPQISMDREGAEGYMEWLRSRDLEIKEKAEQEKADNFPKGNMYWHHWHTGIGAGRRPLKYASYALVTRRVSDWSETE